MFLLGMISTRGLRRRQSGGHVGNNPVDSTFETHVGRVARDRDSRDYQHVLGHRLTLPALECSHKHFLQVFH
jgi:hypothetical protein